MMSGSALASWALVNDANDVALQVAQAADCVHLVGDRSDSETILNCLRDAPLERIEQAAAKVGRPGSFRRFRTIFGPSIDGVVIRGQHLSSGSSSSGSGGPRKRSEDGRPTYDCLFGVSGFESSYQLSELASEQGLDGVERDLLLRAFVADTYRFHQTEIFLTLVNEYTDWERTVQHPISIRESTVEALSDGQFVAPAILLGDTLTSPDKNSYFYVIDPAIIQVSDKDSFSYYYYFALIYFLFGARVFLYFKKCEHSKKMDHWNNKTRQDQTFPWNWKAAK